MGTEAVANLIIPPTRSGAVDEAGFAFGRDMHTRTVAYPPASIMTHARSHCGKGPMRASPWTVGRIIRCTKSKIERMEAHEPGLRRYLLVHKFMASVDSD